MKKLFIFMLVIAVTFGVAYSQSITVTKPASGETVSKGSPYTIQWTKSGAQDALVKIRLYNPAGTTKILDITNSTANDGSFSWPVPNSVANGSYVVRVKTLDNATWDDGAVFTIANTPSESASITVTKPSSLENWVRGHAHAVTWTKTGTQHARVKIRLYNTSGTSKIKDIVNDTANDGSYTTAVSMFDDVPVGRYIIRVRTIDNAVYSDSRVFNVTLGLTLGTVFVAVLKPDFEVKNIYFTDAMGGRVVARIINNGAKYTGNLTLSYKFLPTGISKSVTKRVTLNRGGMKVISLFPKTRAEMGCKGPSLKVTVDSGNRINESNENNNVKVKTVYSNAEHDAKIEYVKVLKGGRYVEVHEGDEIDLGSTISMHIRVRNCGGTRFEGAKVAAWQNLVAVPTESRYRCRSELERIQELTGKALSPGIARTYTITGTLNTPGSHCRITKNEIRVYIDNGERGPRNRNNTLKFKVK